MTQRINLKPVDIKKVDLTYTNRGFTLIDLIMTLGIMSILFGAALPAFDEFLDKQKLISETNKLRGTLHSSRLTAISQNKKVTVCPSSDQVNCHNNWSDGYMAFIDNNGDRQLNQNDELITFNKVQNEKITLRWKAFGGKYSMQWHQTGITNHQNGSFEFCFKDRPKLSRALIITKAGRIRNSKDETGDEIHENSRGENLVC